MGSAPRVAIRVDASAHMGTGHLKRCLSLMQALTEAGADPMLLTRPLDAVAGPLLSARAVTVHWLPAPPAEAPTITPDAPPHAAWAGVDPTQDARETVTALAGWQPDWVVVDHYAFDARWHRAVRSVLGCRLLVIDDTADRIIDADALLDHNWAVDHRAKYAGRLQQTPRWLCGPRFALLSPAYRNAPRCEIRPEVRSIGLFLGGVDPDGASARVLRLCRTVGFGGPVEVASTSASPHLAALRSACEADPAAILTLDEPDLAAFFARHDLQIGAGGGATWERCCIGAPTVGLVLAANQAMVVPELDRLGALRAAQLDDTPSPVPLPALTRVLHDLLADAAARQQLSARAAALVDGRGAQYVALTLLGDTLKLRPACLGDARLLHGWRDHPAVRSVSGNPNPIAYDAHERWMQGMIANPDRWLFVAQVGQVPVGSIRFDRLDRGHVAVSLYLDPDLQGLGLGRRLLVAGEQALLAQRPEGFNVDAYVLPGNTTSQRLFEANGYHGGPLQYLKSVGPLPTTNHRPA